MFAQMIRNVGVVLFRLCAGWMVMTLAFSWNICCSLELIPPGLEIVRSAPIAAFGAASTPSGQNCKDFGYFRVLD